MSAPSPVFLPEAFAISAAPADRNTIPAAPVTTQRASYDLGFPPATMTPVVAGGKPMLGPDMNGILYAISSHTFYQQSGQPYRWSAPIAAAIGGYAQGTILGSTDGVTIWFNTIAANSSDPDAGGAGWVAMYSYGITIVPPTTGGVVTLTPAQATKSVIVISGALIANSQIVLPFQLRRWLIVNTTTGSFTLTVKYTTGTGVAVPQGGYAGPTEVYGNGVNIYPTVAPITLPTAVAPTPDTIVLRSNVGYVYATYFNQNSSAENFTISEVYAGAGDGFLRKINKVNFAANFPISTFAGQVANAQVPVGAVNQYRTTILANSALTGVPTAPTLAAGDSSTKVATTAYANPGGLAAANGWVQLPGGVVLQWGTINFNGNGNDFQFATAAFVVAFPNACWNVQLTGSNTVDGSPINTAGEIIIAVADSYTVNGFRWRVDSNNSQNLAGAKQLRYYAVGN